MEQYLEQNQNREDTCKRQRWHKRGVETAPCVLEWTWPHSHVCGAPWRPGSQTLHFQTLFFLPYSPFPWSPLSFTSFFSFSSPLSLPSFSFGLDRLSRFVFLTITTMRWNFSKFQLSFQAHVTYASLCFLFACASSLTFLPVHLYYLRTHMHPVILAI